MNGSCRGTDPQVESATLSPNLFRAAVAAMVLLGASVLAIASRWGIGLYLDSTVYVGAARGLLAGHGFQFLNNIGELAAVIQYPPGYSWLVAVFAWTGLDALAAARWVSIFFSAANSLLVAYIVRRSTHSYGATLIAVFLSFAAFPMVYINSQALSEPPFIFITLLGFCFLARYIQERRGAWLYWFALAVGVSCLVRYVGIAFGLTGALVIFLLGPGAWRQRFFDAAKFSLLAALPIIAWAVRNYLQAGSPVNRTFGFHPPAPSDLLPALDTAAHWLLPTALVSSAPWPSRMLLLALFLVLGWQAKNLDGPKSLYPRLMICCAAGYASFLLISFSFNNQPLYFDTRTMALPYAALMIVALTIVTRWLQKERPPEKSWRWFGFDCALLLLLALQSINGALWLQLSYTRGIGYATESWRHSELIAFAKQAPPTTAIFTNAPDYFYTLIPRRTAMIPHKIDPYTRQANQHYGRAMTAMGEQLKQSNAVLIYFNDENRLWYLPSINELEGRLPLEKIKAAADGGIYRLNGAAAAPAK